MYCNKSVSKLGCKYKVNYWCFGLHLPHKILISLPRKSVLALLLVLLSSTSFAKQTYYTWVDAQGVIHNTAVATEPSKQKSNPDSNIETNNSEASAGKLIKESAEEKGSDKAEVISGEVYKTEEELQQEIKSD